MKLRVSILSTILILTSLLAPLETPHARAIVGPGVSNPTNLWTPYGPDPSLHNLIMKFYADDTSELNAFQAGQLDLMDSGQGGSMPPVPGWAAFEASPDWVITPKQYGANYYGIYYNLDDTSDGTGTVWHSWGCTFQHGNSLCGIEIRQAFAHLIDRPRYVLDGPLQGGGIALADDVPPTKQDTVLRGTPANPIPVASSLTDQCSWDTLYLANPINSGYQGKYGTCLSAFHIAPSPGGFALPGAPDFCAAVDHLIRATQIAPALGLLRDPIAPLDAFGNHCGIAPFSPGLANIATHPMRAKVRTSVSGLLTMGLRFARAINILLAGNVVNTIGGDPTGQIVSRCCSAIFPTDDWEWSTFSTQDTDPYPTSLFPRFESLSASNVCGGPLVIQPTNPTFVCLNSPTANLDSALFNLSHTLIATNLYTNTYAALNILGSHAVDLPAYSVATRTSSLRSVAGLVNEVGVGYSNRFSFYTAHKSSYVPVDSRFQFNGGGPPDTIRWGQSGDANLNPYFAFSPWELNILGEVYDTLFATSPTQTGDVFCWICNAFSTFIDSNGNEHIVVELKQTLHWQDGVPVDAWDVAFSILTERDFSAALSGKLASVINVNVLNPISLDVTYSSAAIDATLLVGSTLIIPRHIYQQGCASAPCGGESTSAAPGASVGVNPFTGQAIDNTYGQGIGVPDATVGYVVPAGFPLAGQVINHNTLDPGFDPIAADEFIGSGQFECRSEFAADLGRIGTGCVANSDGSRGGQAILPGGSITLTIYDNTGQVGSGPFDQWFRLSNPAWGIGSGNAAFSGLVQEFHWADRYDNDTVTVVDLSALASCFGYPVTYGHFCIDFGYWLKSFTHPGNPTVIGDEVTIAADHLDDNVFGFDFLSGAPFFSWNGVPWQQPGLTLSGLAPFTYKCAPYNQPAPSVTQGSSDNCFPPGLSVSPDVGPTGIGVTVSGAGFTALSTVTISYDGTVQATVPAVVNTNGVGSFSAVITAPASAPCGHTVKATDASSRYAIAVFTVGPCIMVNTPGQAFGPVGSTVSVSGAGFAASSTITISYDGTAQATSPAIVPTTTDGSFSANFIVPASTVGAHTVNAKDAAGGTQSGSFTVTSSTNPSISLTPRTGAVGSTVTVSGAGFASSSSVTISYDAVNQPTLPATVITDSTGAFSATFNAPASTPCGHTVKATDASSRSAIAYFAVFPCIVVNTPGHESGPVGSTVLVSGAGFAPSSTITISYDAVNQPTLPAIITTNSIGAFSATFNVPASTMGVHTVQATDASSNKASASFTVT